MTATGRLEAANKRRGEFLFTGRRGTEQHDRATIRAPRFPGGLAVLPSIQGFSGHTLRPTKATLIYWRTGNLRAVQLSARPYHDREHGLDISASKWMMLWEKRSKLMSDNTRGRGPDR
jgi:hypothetical protein